MNTHPWQGFLWGRGKTRGTGKKKKGGGQVVWSEGTECWGLEPGLTLAKRAVTGCLVPSALVPTCPSVVKGEIQLAHITNRVSLADELGWK